MMVRRTIRPPRRGDDNRWLLVLAGLWTLAGLCGVAAIMLGRAQGLSL